MEKHYCLSNLKIIFKNKIALVVDLQTNPTIMHSNNYKYQCFYRFIFLRGLILNLITVFVMKLSNFQHTQHLIIGDELLILGGVHDIKTGTCIAILFYKNAKISHRICCLSPGALYYHVILISSYHKQIYHVFLNCTRNEFELF